MTISPYVFPFLKPTTLNSVLSTTCKLLETTPEQLRSPKRKQGLLFHRFMFVGFIRENFTKKYANTRGGISEACLFSFPEIGKLLDRDHSTIIHEYRQHKNMMEDGGFPEYRSKYLEIQEYLSRRFPYDKTTLC